jgi:hypothetical protein
MMSWRASCLALRCASRGPNRSAWLILAATQICSLGFQCFNSSPSSSTSNLAKIAVCKHCPECQCVVSSPDCPCYCDEPQSPDISMENATRRSISESKNCSVNAIGLAMIFPQYTMYADPSFDDNFSGWFFYRSPDMSCSGTLANNKYCQKHWRCCHEYISQA